MGLKENVWEKASGKFNSVIVYANGGGNLPYLGFTEQHTGPVSVSKRFKKTTTPIFLKAISLIAGFFHSKSFTTSSCTNHLLLQRYFIFWRKHPKVGM